MGRTSGLYVVGFAWVAEYYIHPVAEVCCREFLSKAREMDFAHESLEQRQFRRQVRDANVAPVGSESKCDSAPDALGGTGDAGGTRTVGSRYAGAGLNFGGRKTPISGYSCSAVWVCMDEAKPRESPGGGAGI